MTRPVARRAAGALRAGARGALLALAGASCFRYVPVERAAPPPDAEVRVRITPEGAARLSREIGRYSTELHGMLARDRADSLALSVALGGTGGAPAAGATRQVLFLAPAEVTAVQRRELARGRTVLASVGGLAAFGLLIAGVVQSTDPNPPEGDPPSPPPAARAVRAVVRLPIF